VVYALGTGVSQPGVRRLCLRIPLDDCIHLFCFFLYCCISGSSKLFASYALLPHWSKKKCNLFQLVCIPFSQCKIILGRVGAGPGRLSDCTLVLPCRGNLFINTSMAVAHPGIEVTTTADAASCSCHYCYYYYYYYCCHHHQFLWSGSSLLARQEHVPMSHGAVFTTRESISLLRCSSSFMDYKCALLCPQKPSTRL
jgi:hypothetical protein